MKRSMLLAAMCAALVLALAPSVMAQANEFNCGDFQFQEDAQEVFNQDTSDPNLLDEDDGVDDGIACESLPSRGAAGEPTGYQYAPAPTNRTPTPDSGRQLMESGGNLPSTGGPSLLFVTGAALLTLGATVLVIARRLA